MPKDGTRTAKNKTVWFSWEKVENNLGTKDMPVVARRRGAANRFSPFHVEKWQKLHKLMMIQNPQMEEMWKHLVKVLQCQVSLSRAQEQHNRCNRRWERQRHLSHKEQTRTNSDT